jgi:DNA-binding NarL/FixJ family response regulator
MFDLARAVVAVHRILILSDQALFAQGVRTLIENAGSAEIVGIEPFGADILDRVMRLQPDIIILGEDQDLGSSFPLALLDAVPNIRVIRLSLDGNVMHVYDGHRCAANKVEDLVAMLNSSSAGSPLAA